MESFSQAGNYSDPYIERETLSGMICDGEYRRYGLAHLSIADFFSPKNQAIFEIIVKNTKTPRLINREIREKFDLETISALLRTSRLQWRFGAAISGTYRFTVAGSRSCTR